MSFVSRHELRIAYEDCIKKKRGTTNAINFEINDSEKLESLYLELNSLQYKIGKSIVFTLTNEQCLATREVFAADFKDRIVHHLLINRIMPKIEEHALIDDNYACRKEKGVLYGVKRCQEKLMEASKNGTIKDLYAFKGDFKNCFNTFNKEKIYKALEQFIITYFANDRKMVFNLWLLKMILMHCPQKKGNYIRKQPKRFWKGLPPEKSMFNLDDNHGIAVGNLSSQIFANFFMGLFDKYVTEILGYKFYGRYVDDFYLFFENKEKFLKDYKLMCQFAEEILDMKINTNKFYLQHYSKGIKFIGYVIHWNRIYVKNATISKFHKLLHELWTIIQLNFKDMHISLTFAERLLSSWNSYVGIFNGVNARNVFLKAINNHQELIEKMSEVFDFDRNGYIKLNSYMKKLQKERYTKGKKKISIDHKVVQANIDKNIYLKRNRKRI